MFFCLSGYWPLMAKRLFFANERLSQVIVTGFAILLTIQYHYGWGRHQAYLDSYQLSKALELNVIVESFGIMGSTLGRMSFIVQVFKLFGINKYLRWSLWALFAAQFIFNLTVAITYFFQCSDVRALWDFSIHASCWSASIEIVSCQRHQGWLLEWS
jgi:hypothetical protein